MENLSNTSTSLDQSLKNLESLSKHFELLNSKLIEKDSNVREIESKINDADRILKTEADLLLNENLSLNTLACTINTLERDISLKNYQNEKTIRESISIKEKQINLEYRLKERNEWFEEKLKILSQYEDHFKSYKLKIDTKNQKLMESDKELTNLKTMISFLSEKKSNIESILPEKIQEMSQAEIERELEILKAKATLITSSIDDLNIEINNYQSELDTVARLESEHTIRKKMKSDLMKKKIDQIKDEIKNKEILLQKKIDFTNKINILIEKLNC